MRIAAQYFSKYNNNTKIFAAVVTRLWPRDEYIKEGV